MRILTPAEIEAFRAVYMHHLAVALIERNSRYWNSATEEERVEVRAALRRAGIKIPSEKAMATRDMNERIADQRKRQAAERKAAKSTKRSKAAATPLPTAE